MGHQREFLGRSAISVLNIAESLGDDREEDEEEEEEEEEEEGKQLRSSASVSEGLSILGCRPKKAWRAICIPPLCLDLLTSPPAACARITASSYSW